METRKDESLICVKAKTALYYIILYYILFNNILLLSYNKNEIKSVTPEHLDGGFCKTRKMGKNLLNIYLNI